jgi:hypothetical protein
VALKSILRRLQSPLFQAGNLAFDCEIEVNRGGRREFTKNRVGAGAVMSDHSFMHAKRYRITAAVSGIVQLQNLGRPGQPFLSAGVTAALGALESLTGLDFSTRVADFEARLDALLNAGEEIEIVSKVVGRRTVVFEGWDATTDPETGDAAYYTLDFEELLRAGDTIADATDAMLELVGSGGSLAPGSGGPSQVSPGTLNAVP